MKRVLCVVAILCGYVGFSYAGQREADFSIRVTDDDGLPVSNATVGVSYLTAGGISGRNLRLGGDVHATVEGQTDTNGIYHYRGEFSAENACGVEKRGYYDTEQIEIALTNIVFGHLQPWGVQHDVTLRRIINPIPMYARKFWEGGSFDGPGVVGIGKPVGFDLIKSDWVSPAGKGVVSDLIVRIDTWDVNYPPDYFKRYPRATRDKNTKLTISFSNPDDGVQPFYSYPMKGSAFRSPRFAPTDGYATNYVLMRRTDGNCLYDDGAREDLNYVFRVRTKRNAQGAVTNALYGKVHGAFLHRVNESKGVFGCTYYLNPTPLDRNLEFDRTRNLLKGAVDDLQLPSEP